MRKYKILVIHGPNLNLLGVRESKIYGTKSLAAINRRIKNFARINNLKIKIFQENVEGEIVNIIHNNGNWADFIVINPAAYTHTSIAIRDAVLSVRIPAIEVHLSNIYSREKFRRKSLISPVCVGVICGFKGDGYIMALSQVLRILKNKNK